MSRSIQEGPIADFAERLTTAAAVEKKAFSWFRDKTFIATLTTFVNALHSCANSDDVKALVLQHTSIEYLYQQQSSAELFIQNVYLNLFQQVDTETINELEAKYHTELNMILNNRVRVVFQQGMPFAKYLRKEIYNGLSAETSQTNENSP